jgi:hypothetical protein
MAILVARMDGTGFVGFMAVKLPRGIPIFGDACAHRIGSLYAESDARVSPQGLERHGFRAL